MNFSRIRIKFYSDYTPKVTCFLVAMFFSFSLIAQDIKFISETKISDVGLHFDGRQNRSTTNTTANTPYDYYFGNKISAYGDCVATYNEYVFMTWYKGGKGVRNVMLTRYNTKTGTQATIEFPHRHTGYQNRWWIGESHNTIAVAVSPLDGTIHMLYDMHAYSRTKPSNGSLAKDYFRYSYSVPDAASVSDADFTLGKFVKNSSGGYKHLSLNGGEDYANFAALTYPKFFLNDAGDLFMYMRMGGNNNGAFKFSKYTASTKRWSSFTNFNVLNAKSKPGITYNWGLYGNIKYVNGKIRIGFQRRSSNNTDKYLYQNGVYYAYSDDQSGKTGWKNHKGESFTVPLYDADKIKVMEPGDYVTTTQTDKVYIVGGFDWTVTEKGDVHIIHQVKDNQNNLTKKLHTYKPAGASEFVTQDFSGASTIYTAGDDIYIIGLSGGRIFVDKAQGGTNNFSRVYSNTTGKTFSHGKIHISKGMLYFFLMQNASGNARPLYLQVVDLGIPDAFKATVTSPSEGDSFTLGDTFQLSANAVDEGGSISKVAFTANGVTVGEDTTAPYSVAWTPPYGGSYAIQAIAHNNNNQTATSYDVKITVNDPNDTDGDGIANAEDECPNTPIGAVVDAQGCEVFSLPSDNFSIQLLSETCTGKSNGQVLISATDTHDYVATIDGVSYDFTTTTTLSDLVPGTYDLCISVTGKDYEQCYSVTIAGGVGLSGQIQVTGTTAQVALVTGTAPFTVFKNGQQVFQTQEKSFTVGVANGDALRVTSKEACEGELTTRVDMLEGVRAYPNPTTGVFTLYVPQASNKLDVEVYNVHSQLISSGSYDVRGGKVALDIHDAPQGVYFVKLSTPAPVFIKIIKK